MRWISLWLICLTSALPSRAFADHFQADDPVFVAPLIESYAIEKMPEFPTWGSFTYGTNAVVKLGGQFDRGTSPASVPTAYIVPNVDQIGFAGKLIFGAQAGGQYFIFDTVEGDRHGIAFDSGESDWSQSLRTFSSLEELKRVLAGQGIVNIRLQTPDQYAATLPDRVTHAWNYTFMRGMWGLSDDTWCGLVVSGGFIASILVSLTGHPRRHRWVLVIIIALAADSLGEAWIEQGANDGSIMGILFYPIIYCVVHCHAMVLG